MKPLDWRFLTRKEAADLHDGETGRWLSALHWDTRPSVVRIEAARQAGALPGLVVRDEQGIIRGWTFYLVHQGVLQVGAFVAESSVAAAALLDAIVAAPEARTASSTMLFVFSTAPDLAEHLTARGFAVERYRYLQVALAAGGPAFTQKASARPGAAANLAHWNAAQLDEMAALLRHAYASDHSARPFARGGTPLEWQEYVRQLLTTNACGAFAPEASFLVRGTSASDLDGATLMTRLMVDTAHLAQIAVAPESRGRGLARQLLEASLDAARLAGCTRATLLVSERNESAGRLYANMGFEEVAAFVSASRDGIG